MIATSIFELEDLFKSIIEKSIEEIEDLGKNNLFIRTLARSPLLVFNETNFEKFHLLSETNNIPNSLVESCEILYSNQDITSYSYLRELFVNFDSSYYVPLLKKSLSPILCERIAITLPLENVGLYNDKNKLREINNITYYPFFIVNDLYSKGELKSEFYKIISRSFSADCSLTQVYKNVTNVLSHYQTSSIGFKDSLSANTNYELCTQYKEVIKAINNDEVLNYIFDLIKIKFTKIQDFNKYLLNIIVSNIQLDLNKFDNHQLHNLVPIKEGSNVFVNKITNELIEIDFTNSVSINSDYLDILNSDSNEFMKHDKLTKIESSFERLKSSLHKKLSDFQIQDTMKEFINSEFYNILYCISNLELKTEQELETAENIINLMCISLIYHKDIESDLLAIESDSLCIAFNSKIISDTFNNDRNLLVPDYENILNLDFEYFTKFNKYFYSEQLLEVFESYLSINDYAVHSNLETTGVAKYTFRHLIDSIFLCIPKTEELLEVIANVTEKLPETLLASSTFISIDCEIERGTHDTSLIKSMKTSVAIGDVISNTPIDNLLFKVKKSINNILDTTFTSVFYHSLEIINDGVTEFKRLSTFLNNNNVIKIESEDTSSLSSETLAVLSDFLNKK